MIQSKEDIICCPVCKGPLELMQEQNALKCNLHGEFAINFSIPSFSTLYHFDKHWEENFSPDIPPMKELAAGKFLSPLYDNINKKESLKILDAGCGDGVHVKVLKNNTLFENVQLTGLDISMSALLSAQKRDDGKWNFVHADISELPFKNNFFDVVFSYGVLAYTAKPYLSFQELVRVTKPKGLIGIWIYPKAKGWGGFMFGLVRNLCKLTGDPGTKLIANCIVPFLGFLPTQSKLNLSNSSWKQCREIVFVNIAPKQLYFPEPQEIERWFVDNGIEIIINDGDHPVTIWGRK